MKESSHCNHAEGQGHPGSASLTAPDIPRQDETAARSPLETYFVSHRQQRDVLPEGKYRHHYLLIDQHGAEHLAVVGEEVNGRSGHYTYQAVSAGGLGNTGSDQDSVELCTARAPLHFSWHLQLAQPLSGFIHGFLSDRNASKAFTFSDHMTHTHK